MDLFCPIATRLEEKEAESKGEYNKLHSRYTELLRSHCDLMERVKILIGCDGVGETSSGPSSIQASAALRNFLAKKSEMDERLESETRNADGRVDRVLDLASPLNPKVWLDTELSLEDASIIEDVDDIPRDKEPSSLGKSPHTAHLSSSNHSLLLLRILMITGARPTISTGAGKAFLSLLIPSVFGLVFIIN